VRYRRLPPIARGIVVIALALQSLAGICGPACGEPGVDVAPASVAAGAMHARKGEQEADLPITGETAEASTCSLRATLGSSTPDDGKAAVSFLFDDPEANTVMGYFSLDVRNPSSDDAFSISIVTSDPRAWSSLGEVPAADVAASVRVTSYEACASDGDCSLCELDVPDASVRFVVEESAGATDDSQNRVSDDFQRKLTLELDLGGAVVPVSRETGEACSRDVEASGSATFSWTSDDFVWIECS
jgi:hypothetical protein